MKRQSGRIRVIVIDEDRIDGVSWWRNARPFMAMEKMYGGAVEVLRRSDRVDVRELMTADVVVRFRPTSQQTLDWMHLVKSLDVRVILDIDDDLWHIPPQHPLYGDYLRWGGRLHEIYGMADAIWTSTEQLRYVVGDMGRAECMPNAILPEELPDAPTPWKSIAAWRGNDKQVADVASDFAKYWYAESQDKYDTWVFKGYLPALPHGPNVRFEPKEDVLSYFLNLRRGFANVLWKPLEENLFNDSKSNIAWIEATMSGAVCVTNYAGGANPAKDGWEYALQDFPTDPEEVADVWAASRDHILEKYNLEEITRRRYKSICRLVGVTSPVMV